MNRTELTQAIKRYRHHKELVSRDAAVLIPILDYDSDPKVLLEVRAASLPVQPGEVCLPGGRIEPFEDPQEAAVRETCEELLVSSSQITILGSMGAEPGPGRRPLHVFVGTLCDYEGTFSADEVQKTFTLPLGWLATHEPHFYEVGMRPEYPEDFPWELVPNGKQYAWRTQTDRVPFYPNTDPVIWGATARILWHFSQVCHACEDHPHG